MSVQAELFRAGQDILSREPLLCQEHMATGMLGQWANDHDLNPGLFIGATFERRWNTDVRTISSMVFGVMHPELGYSSVQVGSDATLEGFFENEFGKWYLRQFRVYSQRPFASSVGWNGLDSVIKQHRAMRLATNS